LKAGIVIAEVVSKSKLASGIFLIKLKSSHLAENARPGCFVMVQPDKNTDPLLRRPFTLCGVSGDVVEVLFQVKGRGTEIMSNWEIGRAVDILGPLGNGFFISSDLKQAYLVGGGMGIAPLLFLAGFLKKNGVKVKIFMGAKTVSETFDLDAFKLDGCEVYSSTEDGSKGAKGLVTGLLADTLTADSSDGIFNSAIFCCGPLGMAEVISQTALSFRLPCQVSIEEKMACGVGACLGCVTYVKANKYKRVCVDGPVFNGSDIDWKKLKCGE